MLKRSFGAWHRAAQPLVDARGSVERAPKCFE
jgi:hypothetical protein